MPSVKPRRAYNSTRRRDQANATRQSVVDAARGAFVANGYAATTLAAIAATAAVSVETIYKLFGNKPGLVKAVFDHDVVGDAEPVPMMQREFVQRNMSEPDPRRKLEMYGAHLAEVNPRVGPLLLVIRDAAASDPGAADTWRQLQAERLTGMTAFAQQLDGGHHLRDDVSADEARDVLWTHNSAEVWDLLVNQRGWTPERYGQWIGTQLVAALLPKAKPAPAPAGKPTPTPRGRRR
jgi:AcrR family transcriptional regulator